MILVGRDGHICFPIFNGNGYITIPIIDDRLDELFWAFTSNKRFENIVKLLDQEDKSNLLSWMKYLLLEKQDQVFVKCHIDDLNGFIAFLEKDMANQPA